MIHAAIGKHQAVLSLEEKPNNSAGKLEQYHHKSRSHLPVARSCIF